MESEKCTGIDTKLPRYLHVQTFRLVVYLGDTKLRFLAVHPGPSVITAARPVFDVASSTVVAVVLTRADAVAVAGRITIILFHVAEVASAVTGCYAFSVGAVFAEWFTAVSVSTWTRDEAVVALADLWLHAGSIVANLAERHTATFFILLVARVTGALVRRRASTIPAVDFADRLTDERNSVSHRSVTFFAYADVWSRADPVVTARFRAYRIANVRGALRQSVTLVATALVRCAAEAVHAGLFADRFAYVPITGR